MSRFIVRMHPYIHKNTYWRSGVVLAYNGSKALVKADREDKKIFIWVSGPERARRTFLAIIRAEFDAIHRTISRIEAAEKVPLPAHPEIVVDYKHLLNLEALGEESFIPEGLSEKVNVRQLLDGVVSEQERRERQEIRMREEKPKPRPTPPPPEPEKPKATPVSGRKSPWVSGLFYLLGLAVIMGLIAVISQNVAWYVLPIVIIGGLLAISVIGALQLRQDERLGEANFLKLMIESFKRMPLLRGAESPQELPEGKEEAKSD
jgi:internalin A